MKKIALVLCTVFMIAGGVNANSVNLHTLEPIKGFHYEDIDQNKETASVNLEKRGRGVTFYIKWIRNKIKKSILRWMGIEKNESAGTGLLVGWILSALFSILLFSWGVSASGHILTALLAIVFYVLGALLAILALVLFFSWLSKISESKEVRGTDQESGRPGGIFR